MLIKLLALVAGLAIGAGVVFVLWQSRRRSVMAASGGGADSAPRDPRRPSPQ